MMNRTMLVLSVMMVATFAVEGAEAAPSGTYLEMAVTIAGVGEAVPGYVASLNVTNAAFLARYSNESLRVFDQSTTRPYSSTGGRLPVHASYATATAQVLYVGVGTLPAAGKTIYLYAGATNATSVQSTTFLPGYAGFESGTTPYDVTTGTLLDRSSVSTGSVIGDASLRLLRPASAGSGGTQDLGHFVTGSGDPKTFALDVWWRIDCAGSTSTAVNAHQDIRVTDSGSTFASYNCAGQYITQDGAVSNIRLTGQPDQVWRWSRYVVNETADTYSIRYYDENLNLLYEDLNLGTAVTAQDLTFIELNGANIEVRVDEVVKRPFIPGFADPAITEAAPVQGEIFACNDTFGEKGVIFACDRAGLSAEVGVTEDALLAIYGFIIVLGVAVFVSEFASPGMGLTLGGIGAGIGYVVALAFGFFPLWSVFMILLPIGLYYKLRGGRQMGGM